MPADRTKDFALLIGKRLDDKEKGDKGKPPVTELPEEESDVPMGGSPDEPADDESSSMQDSAVADLMSAIEGKNIPAAKQALKDFISLVDDDSAENAEEE